jgi:hypothetical protein
MSFFFPSSLFSLQKITAWLSWLLAFQLQSLFFWFLIFNLGYLFYLFSISSLNSSLPNIIFSDMVLIIWISNFFCPFIKVLIRAEHFLSGPVLDQNKQPNRFYFFLVFKPNQTKNRFKPINFGSGFFPSKPVQTEIFRLSFFWAFKWPDFSVLLFIYLLPNQ